MKRVFVALLFFAGGVCWWQGWKEARDTQAIRLERLHVELWEAEL